MKRIDKGSIIDSLSEKIANSQNFYLADISDLNAEATYKLRKVCFEKKVTLQAVKNSLLKKAFEKSGKQLDELLPLLNHNTSVMFSETANAPAQAIKEFRKSADKPILKGAYVQESIYIGDDQLDVLSAIKSKEELLGDIIGLLQSPIKNVISSLKSGQNKLTGLVKALEERAQ
ncbi:MAG: 50S ribosomal protein L10 [Bacteroidales bacterium]|jgi:large subunit ribosomal protein L10|nr:50S ribosomal protein L10 [Bacteroidales bacterium]